MNAIHMIGTTTLIATLSLFGSLDVPTCGGELAVEAEVGITVTLVFSGARDGAVIETIDTRKAAGAAVDPLAEACIKGDLSRIVIVIYNRGV